MLSPVLAQQIATETTAAIGHNVIITDAEGMVIGSGDPARVGSFHEASVEVMRTQESAWHSAEQARALTGVLAGTTLPVVVDGAAVGTVGITGSPRQVRRFGLLVRRQTEILLAESALLRSRLQRERALEDLVTEIAAFHPDTSDPELLTAWARDLGYTLDVARAPILIEVDGAAVGPELLRTVRAIFHHAQDIAAMRSTNRCLVLAHQPEPTPRRHDVERLAETIRARFAVNLRISVAEPAATLEDMRWACHDAEDALTLGARTRPGTQILDIRELRTQQALASMQRRARHRLITAAAGALRTGSDWPILRSTIIAWCDSGFNLVTTAAALHVHRNTVLYRLDKIEQLAGHPWRDHQAMLTLHLACIADLLDP